MSWSEVPSFRSRVLEQWESTSKKIPRGDWNIKYRGLSLDFTTKANQSLAHDFERLLLFQRIAKQMMATSTVRIIECPQFRYFRKIDPSADFSSYPRLPIVSHANILFDFIFNYVFTLAQTLRLTKDLLFACLSKERIQSFSNQDIPLIWDAVDRYELTLDPKLRTFTWIVDGKEVSHDDVIFILPRNASRKSRPDIYQSDYRAYTTSEIYRQVPSRFLIRGAMDLTLYNVRSLFSRPNTFRSNELRVYFSAIVRMDPVIQCVKPACYITNVSRIAYEDPLIIYLNEIGVRTVLYSYSGNSHLFSDIKPDGDFRNITFANILASKLVVWNENYKDYALRHPQANTDIQVIGPLMDGDENVCRTKSVSLRSKIGIEETESRRHLRYISIFDIPAFSKSTSLDNSLFPYAYTEDYVLAFLKDIMKLWEECQDVSLVFKPKRDIASGQYSHNNEYLDIVETLRNSERAIIVSDTINPWLPVAISDLCIGMPFTSPSWAAMHYGIPGLFHDPAGIAAHHEYERIEQFTSHNYEQLNSKVRSILYSASTGDSDERAVWAQASNLIGVEPGTNSSDRFRRFLMGNARDEINGAERETRVADIGRR